MHESRDFRGADRQIELDETKRMAEAITAFHKTEGLLELDFKDVYPEQEIDSDIELVDKLKSRFDENLGAHFSKQDYERVTTISTAMEHIIIEHGYSSEWFGPESYVIKTTEYDDIVNGVDFVVEFDIEDPSAIDIEGSVHRIALAVDATSVSANTHVIEEKIQRCLDKVLGKKPSSVKYFQSSVEEDVRGELPSVIPVVVGIERERTRALVQNVHRYESLSRRQDLTDEQKNEMREMQKNIAEDPSQIMFLIEILKQLELYRDVLRTQEQRPFYVQELKGIDSLSKIIRNILENKQEIGLSDTGSDNDLTFQTIINYTKKRRQGI